MSTSDKTTMKFLSEVLHPPISGGRPKGGVSTDTEGVPSLGGENVLVSGGITYDVIKRVPKRFFDSMPKGKLQAGDVLINKDGAQTGKVGYYDGELFEEAAVNEHLFILRGLSEGIVEQSYLYYSLLLPETQRKIERRITGSAQPGLNSGFVKAVDIPYHASTRQKKISQILRTVDQAIDKTESLIAKYQQIKAGLMHDLFTRGVTPDGKLRPPREQAPELYKETPIGWIPKEWDTGYIGDLFNIQLGKMLSKAAKTGKWNAKYLGNKNVQWDKVDLRNLEEMDFLPSEREKFRLLPGDLLICEGGEVGRTAIWNGELADCYYQKAIHRLRPKDESVKSEYLLRYMRYAKERGFLNDYTSQTSIAHLTQEQLSKVWIAVPSKDEQALISLRFDSIDLKIVMEQEHLLKLKNIKTGLMRDLLTGRVQMNSKSTAKEA